MRAAVIALGLLIAATFPAWADEPALMTMFDTDHDGCVSLDEYRAYMDRGFRRMDANGDGVLDGAELPAGNDHRAPLTLDAHHRNVARQFHRQDTNHDGCLDLHELMAPPR